MERSEALEIVKQQLTERRFQHTLGVMETAIELAKRYGADVKKAELAAIFHDYAKYRPYEEMGQIIIQQNLGRNLLTTNPEVWHGPVGAYLVQKEVGITDEEILNAIRYHTSGRPNMTLLEKIIFLADYIEPGRKFPGVEEVRNLANNDLDEAVLKATQNTIQFLVTSEQVIFEDTIHTYNDYIKQRSGIDD